MSDAQIVKKLVSLIQAKRAEGMNVTSRWLMGNLSWQAGNSGENKAKLVERALRKANKRRA